MGGCGDVVRNITGCPVAGVDHDELFDVTGLISEAAAFFYGNRDYSDLPRKHKITIAACPVPVQRARDKLRRPGRHRQSDGREGFAVRVGGGQSSTPRLSRHLGVFVPREQAIAAMRAIHRRLAVDHRVSDFAGQGAAQVHDRRLRPGRISQAGRSAARLCAGRPAPSCRCPIAKAITWGSTSRSNAGTLLCRLSSSARPDDRAPDARSWQRSPATSAVTYASPAGRISS